MQNVNDINRYPVDRELLEVAALQAVCACQYYDLADYLEITSDVELIDIIDHNYTCELCGQKPQDNGAVS